jgi:hypothetical protein
MHQVNYENSNNVRNGCIAESMFSLEAMKRGYDVFNPTHHSTPSDLIICKPCFPAIKIQIKKMVFQERGKDRKPGWSCKTSSTRTSNLNNKNYRVGAFDVLIGVVVEKEKFVFKTFEQSQQTKSFWYFEDRPTEGTNNWEMLNQIKPIKPKLFTPQKDLFELVQFN